MAFVIEPFTSDHTSAAEKLNERLREGGIEPGFFLPETAPAPYGSPVDGFEKLQFAVLDQDQLRGGCLLQRQLFQLGGEPAWITNCQMPITEGIVNPRFASVGVRLIRQLQGTHPELFCLGMGGMDKPLPRLLKALSWSIQPIPFFFRVFDGSAFVREVRPLASRPQLRRLLSVLPFAVPAAQHIRAFAAAGPIAPLTKVSIWPNTIDQIWTAAAPALSFGAQRTATSLNLAHGLHPRIERFLIGPPNQPQAWFAVLLTHMKDNPYFGNLKVGTLVDFCALPGLEVPALAAITQHLRHAGSQILIANLSQSAWTQAFNRLGFLQAPANYLLALSPALAAKAGNISSFHITRGDGEGPTHL